MRQNNFALLNNKEIINIFIGDTNFGNHTFDGCTNETTIAMPYLNGLTLCNISTLFGLSTTYPSSGALSRWQYFEALLEFCIKENREHDLLAYLFAKDKFSDRLRGLPSPIIDTAHALIIEKVLEKINSLLYFGGNELYVVGTRFQVRKINSTVTITAPSIKVIDRAYINGLSERAINDIHNGDFDSAITKSRTILEETFCFVLEKKNTPPTGKEKIGELYNQVKKSYNMHADKNNDIRVNTLLSGLEKIVSSIAEMRNKEGDAHGVGGKRIGISDYHARLFVNSATAMADFILSVHLNTIKK